MMAPLAVPAAARLTEAGEEVVDILTSLGVSKPVAFCVVVLANRGEVSSAELGGMTGLRQPDVSRAMRSLRDRGWAVKREEPRLGKGRPVHRYRLLLEPKDIGLALERDLRRTSESRRAAIGRLREAVTEAR
jgi:predicted transcriptional regulator